MSRAQTSFHSISSDELIQRTRATGVLPTIKEQTILNEEEQALLADAWLAGMEDAAECLARTERERFKARGWPFRWLAEWDPQSDEDKAMANAIDEAIEVVDRSYRLILLRGLNRAEDMGILQVQSFGKSEGVQVKREAYGSLVLVSVHCVTGPRNFDGSTGTLEFEQGARSHVFHLVYRELPTAERLAGDIAAYPVIRSQANRAQGSGTVWMSEGWTGPGESRPRLHRPWDTIAVSPLSVGGAEPAQRRPPRMP